MPTTLEQIKIEPKQILEDEIVYDSLNSDRYRLELFENRALASCHQTMDDHFFDFGYTNWKSELPKDLVAKCLQEFQEKDESQLEIETIVKKSSKNRYVYGIEENSTDYDYKVRIELKKVEDKTQLRIKFQDHMEIYF